VVKSWKELGIPLKDIPPTTRASVLGEVPGKMNYRKWMYSLRGSKDPRSLYLLQQRLGKKKGLLFHQGKFALPESIRFAPKSSEILGLGKYRKMNNLPTVKRL
jgi:hypothetical protein